MLGLRRLKLDAIWLELLPATANSRADQANIVGFQRRLREHGQARKYFHDIEGYNGRLDALQAAFLRIKLRRLEQWNAARRTVAWHYRERIGEVRDVRPVAETAKTVPVYHLFVVRTPQRDQVRDFLESRGIGTGLHYPLPLHLQVAYRHRGEGAGAFPAAEQAAGEILSLPMFPEMTTDQVDRVMDALEEFFVGLRRSAGAAARLRVNRSLAHAPRVGSP